MIFRKTLKNFTYAFRCHVWPTTCIPSFSYGIHQFSRNAKVTQFNVSSAIKQNVGWLDISMDNLELVFEIIKSPNNCRGDLTNNSFRNYISLNRVYKLVKLVQANIHELHTYPAITFLENGSIKCDWNNFM